MKKEIEISVLETRSYLYKIEFDLDEYVDDYYDDFDLDDLDNNFDNYLYEMELIGDDDKPVNDEYIEGDFNILNGRLNDEELKYIEKYIKLKKRKEKLDKLSGVIAD